MSARKHHGRVVTREITIRATPAQVYAAFADPAAIARWFVDAAEGVAKPGEVMTWIFRDFNLRLPVPIIDAKPNAEFVTGGEIPGRLPALMEVFIEQDGGTTKLRLVNSGFAEGAQWEEEYQGVSSGWTMALATLKHALERYPNKSRVHLLSMRPAALEFAKLRALHTTADGLKSWLAQDVRIAGPRLAEGVTYEMQTKGMGPLSGTVVADTGRELLLEWKEQDAVLGLKYFLAGPAQMVCLDLSAWKDGVPLLAKGFLDGSLEALVAKLGLSGGGSRQING
jgi:uncharacterized protein YndB with AHSA1/START domain